MEMDKKGVTWVGNICKKFENMCLEMEDTLDATYLESQMRIVSKSVTRFYSDVMKELLPLSPRDSDETTTAELHIDQNADICFCKKSCHGFKQIAVKANSKLATVPTQDSSINHDFDNDAIYAESCDSGANSDDNQQIENMLASNMTAAEITLSETNTVSTSQSCEISKANQNHEATNSKSSSAEATTLASVTDNYNEIENASVEQTSSVVEFVKSAEEEVVFEDPSGFSLVGRMQPDDSSYNTAAASHPGIANWLYLRGQDNGFEKDRGVMTAEKKRWQPFSLSKRSARKQEYEELATWHDNNENGQGDYVESSCPTLLEDQKKPLLPELDWELL